MFCNIIQTFYRRKNSANHHNIYSQIQKFLSLSIKYKLTEKALKLQGFYAKGKYFDSSSRDSTQFTTKKPQRPGAL